jgi:hypothetical protein
MNKALLTVLSVSFAWGCAAGGQASPGTDRGVELAVQNGGRVRVTAFVQWDTRRPVRLGEVAVGETATFNVPVGGVTLRVLAGDAARSGPSGRVPAAEVVRRGDRFLWVFQANGFIQSMRLPAN